MGRPRKPRPVRPQDKLEALALALRFGRINIQGIALYEGSNLSSVRAHRYLLPCYGKADKQRNRSWSVLEYLAWRRIPLGQRIKGISSNHQREAVLREYQAHLEGVNLFDILDDLRSSQLHLVAFANGAEPGAQTEQFQFTRRKGATGSADMIPDTKILAEAVGKALAPVLFQFIRP